MFTGMEWGDDDTETLKITTVDPSLEVIQGTMKYKLLK
jgi:hypothetical protein